LGAQKLVDATARDDDDVVVDVDAPFFSHVSLKCALKPPHLHSHTHTNTHGK